MGDGSSIQRSDHIPELHALQWRISESLIGVLSTIESKWDPYKPQKDVDLALMKRYLDVWFHLVTVVLAEPLRGRSSRCRRSPGRSLPSGR